MNLANTIRASFALCIFTATSVLASGAAVPAQNCANTDFKGVYSAAVVGSFISIPGFPSGPTARVGRVQVDGNGVSSILATVSLLGIIAPESYGGSYTISPDCTASVTLQVPFPGIPTPVPLQFNGVVSNGGRSMNLLLVNPPGTDLRITLSKQRKPVCTAGDLSGDYALAMSGTIMNAFMTPSGPLARVGKATFDGVGAFSATAHTSYAGFIQAETFSGTYAVDPNCSFKASANLGLGLLTWYGVLADSISGANVIESDSGTVITGTLTSVY